MFLIKSYSYFQQLTDTFRYNYSKLWLGIITKNKEDMKTYAKILGIREELYALFACMVSGRPWESILKGIHETMPSSNEVSMLYLSFSKIEVNHFL